MIMQPIIFINKIIGNKNFLKSYAFRNFYLNTTKRIVVNEEPENCNEIRLENHTKPFRKKRIIYNDVLYERRKLRISTRKAEKPISQDPDQIQNVRPVSLKYLVENYGESSEKRTDDYVHFPFHIRERFLKETEMNVEESEHNNEKNTELTMNMETSNKWIAECNFVKDGLSNDNIPLDVVCGTADPNVPVSRVPCGGCGAFLHCCNMTIPGFLPKEVFSRMNETDLRSMTCQRCHFLKEFDTALGVNVSPDEYPRIISRIKYKKALVIIMIDLLDFPCSIWPNIMDVIGQDKPIIIVGNKIDLFIQDSPSFLTHMKKCLIKSLCEYGLSSDNIKEVMLISAKTGYNVDSLITKIHRHWGDNGDIYIIGCTNAGKSTLFNALINSDLCQIKAADLMQRATVSYWPGTTLHLLKFPILNLTPKQKYFRTVRIIEAQQEEQAKRAIIDREVTSNPTEKQITLTGFVGRTFVPAVPDSSEDPNASRNDESMGYLGINPRNFPDSKWCYDTPGVVEKDQVLHLLTAQELVKTIPKEMILPRNFKLHPGHTLFVGGLGRLDFLSGSGSSWFTVFASKELPVTITKIEEAESLYLELLGSDLLAVPSGNEERLKKWPKLRSKKLEICGKYNDEGAADVVLSSAGWVTITVRPAHYCNLEVWTPEGRGIFAREPSVVKNAYKFRGMKIPFSPAYEVEVKICDEGEILKGELR